MWLKERVIHREIRTHHDPAVVIERFVLTGWGERETRAELERRGAEAERIDRSEFVNQHQWTENVTRWTAGLGIAAYALSQFGSIAFLLLAVLLLGAAAWHAWLWLENAVRYYRPAEAWQVYACGFVGRVLRWGSLLTLIKGVAIMAWPVGLSGVVLGGVSALLLNRTNSILGVPVFTTKI